MRQLVVLCLYCLCFTPHSASAQSTTDGSTVNLNFAIGKSGIGLGPMASSEFHILSRLNVDPLIRCSWTPDYGTHGGNASATQCGFGVGSDLMVARPHKFEIDASFENGFLQTRIRYNVVIQGQPISGTQKQDGYYASFGGKVKHPLGKSWSWFAAGGMILVGDPTHGDARGRTLFATGVSREVRLRDFGKIKQLF